ncbi:MAG: SpoVA/SpoVAEb family sporulation membrane protein [Acutalibacteraceae bacterium]
MLLSAIILIITAIIPIITAVLRKSRFFRNLRSQKPSKNEGKISLVPILTQAEGFVTGMAAKMFIIAGPVIVYGTVASVLYGVILVIFGG